MNTVPGLNMEPVVEHSSRSSCWTDDMKKQNDDVLNDDELDESVREEEPALNPMEFISVHDDTNIDVSIERIDTQEDDNRIQEIVENTILKYILNKKQRKAFEVCIENVIKRHRNEEKNK